MVFASDLTASAKSITGHDTGNGERESVGGKSRFLIACLVIALACQLIAAWFNEGSIHPDAHFQLLEFAHSKLQPAATADLPWEYTRQMRPAIQPFLVFIVYQAMDAFGTPNPFHVSLVLRVVSSLLALGAMLFLYLVVRPWFTSVLWRRVLLVALCFGWFYPLVRAQFSSENWAGSFLCIGIGLLLVAFNSERERKAIWLTAFAGLSFGLSFYLRFPVGFSLAALAIWVLTIRRPPLSLILSAGFGFAVALVLNLVIDRWFYGEWVLSPVNYFVANIVEHFAASMGVDPWWYYLQKLFEGLIPPFSVVLLVALIAGCVFFWSNPIVWILAGYLISHAYIDHKESRFLIPILNFLPVVMSLGLSKFAERYRELSARIWRSRVIRAAVGLFVAINILLYGVAMTIPAHQSAVIQRWLYERAQDDEIHVIMQDKSPYERGKLAVNFYRSPAVKLVRVAGTTPLANLATQDIQLDSPTTVVFSTRLEVPRAINDACGNWYLQYTSLPGWLRWPYVLEKLQGKKLWALYTCDSSSAAQSH